MLSFIIPAYNEEHELSTTLAAMRVLERLTAVAIKRHFRYRLAR